MFAEYDDGTIRDVTRLGIFTANNDPVRRRMPKPGTVIAGDAGETAIVARFERTFAATSVMVVDPGRPIRGDAGAAESFDRQHVVEKLNRLKIAPSPLAGDEEFLRRVYLDLIGVQPRPDEVKAFLADKRAGETQQGDCEAL